MVSLPSPSPLLRLQLKVIPNTTRERSSRRFSNKSISSASHPKSFYTELAAFATNEIDRLALQFIGSAEGSSTFKKMNEIDTVTFADVLKQFESARPGVEILCELVGDIKPRHYSIASSQAVVGDRVDLLVVTVEWQTPSGLFCSFVPLPFRQIWLNFPQLTGSPRYGQCTRYLAGLKPGQKVTVSIKPSVMKLPPDSRKPLILARPGYRGCTLRALPSTSGLGSGNKAFPLAQSTITSALVTNLRSTSMEKRSRRLSMAELSRKAGLAFSRDGPKKVYIQHKIVEDGDVLARSLLESEEEEGSAEVYFICVTDVACAGCL